jgi:cytochrome P450
VTVPTKPEDVSSSVRIDVDHHTDAFNLNELDEWAVLRERCPVAFNTRYGGFWMVTNYEGVAQVARDGETFAHKYAPNAPDGIDYYGETGIPRPEGVPALGIGEVDGPYHQELRRALNPFLSPPAVDVMRPFMEQSVTWFLDQKIETGAMDLVLDYTNPVPAALTMKMMGLPCDDWKRYADMFHAVLSYPVQSEEYMRATAPMEEMGAQLLEFAAARRADPKDDLTSFLVRLEIEGAPLSDAQIYDILWNLIGGGVDTTTSLTSWALNHLAAHPELRTQLIERPELYVNAADAFLRYYSVNQTLSRTVTRDVELCGQQLRRNDRVLISWLSANHDATEFDRPDEVVLDRRVNRHLAFGLGPHRCIGSHLARVMFTVMVKEVLERIPDYTVDLDTVRQYLGSPAMTGLVDLPATFTPGPVVGVAKPF